MVLFWKPSVSLSYNVYTCIGSPVTKPSMCICITWYNTGYCRPFGSWLWWEGGEMDGENQKFPFWWFVLCIHTLTDAHMYYFMTARYDLTFIYKHCLQQETQMIFSRTKLLETMWTYTSELPIIQWKEQIGFIIGSTCMLYRTESVVRVSLMMPLLRILLHCLYNPSCHQLMSVTSWGKSLVSWSVGS